MHIRQPLNTEVRTDGIKKFICPNSMKALALAGQKRPFSGVHLLILGEAAKYRPPPTICIFGLLVQCSFTRVI